MAGINFYTIKTNDKLLNANGQNVVARSFLFCHCEERSDAAITYPVARNELNQNQKNKNFSTIDCFSECYMLYAYRCI
jgi:hypothetical protein